MASAGASLSAQVPASAGPAAAVWASEGDHLRHLPSGISLPTSLPDFPAAETSSISRPGSGQDEAVKWQATVGNAAASAFVFMPSLADSGVAAEMADLAIHGQFGAAATIVEDRLVAAGGVPGALRTMIYGNARIGNRPAWTAVAVVRAGNWIVVLRAVGEVEHQAALHAAFDAMVAGLRFAGPAQPQPFHTLQVTDCALLATREAKPVQPTTTDLADALTLTSAIDSGAKPAATRVPDQLCRAILDSNRGRKLLLWPADATKPAPAPQIASLLVVSDGGLTLEVQQPLKSGAPYFLVGHNVGVTAMLASLDAPLNQDQLLALAEGQLGLVGKPLQGATYAADGKIVIHGPAPGAAVTTPGKASVKRK